MKRVVIDLSKLYFERAKLAELEDYINKALELAGEGQEVVLTGYIYQGQRLQPCQRVYTHLPSAEDIHRFHWVTIHWPDL